MRPPSRPSHAVLRVSLTRDFTHRLKNVFLKVTPKENGAFLRYSGETMPW